MHYMLRQLKFQSINMQLQPAKQPTLPTSTFIFGYSVATTSPHTAHCMLWEHTKYASTCQNKNPAVEAENIYLGGRGSAIAHLFCTHVKRETISGYMTPTVSGVPNRGMES